ncbi:MAG TPA: hypothetical protein VF997_08310, partial [Polyangia bacterium]
MRALVLVVVVAVGCAPHAPAGPADTLHAFADAVRAGRTDDAYALMSADYRKTHDRDAFARSLSPSDQRALGRLAKGH